ncbi:MAG: TetR/AcrR family transcriptional regulator, partial [Acidimicrobiia bacterium]|nr:TetR/AcrR family transcriptional regulator [Acidimicrobiia bacterium]
MARSGPKPSAAATSAKPRSRGRGANSEGTRERLLAAALETLVEEGYASASARAIAGRAGCNQAVIYYHFGGVDELLASAVNRSGRQRLERYRVAMAELTDPAEIITTWRELHREDIQVGHVPALVELLGGVASSEILREGLGEAVQPSMDFITETIGRVVEA